MADERESFEAHEMENLKPSEEQEEEEDEEEEEEEEGEESERGSGVESRSLESEVGGELRASQSETLAVRSSSEVPEKDRCGGVKVNSTSKSNDGDQSEEQVGKPPEEVLAVAVVHDAGVQTENQHRSTGCRNSLELSPTSVTQPISSAPSPTTIDHKLSPPQDNDLCRPKADQQNSLALKTMTPISAVKIPSSDGYNWRKYGQKQVKSPKGSRSYYKCTYSECYAKKIECSDHSGCVTEVVYKGQHTHDPPKKKRSAKEKFSSAERVFGNNVAKQHWGVPKDSDPSTSAKQSTHETPLCPDRKRHSLANSDENGNTMLVKDEDDNDNETEPKQRLKKSHLEDLGSLLKPSKKPKFVIHAAGDVGISADGYRWRKYGQKMVKGNPHPRNYYRCTSAGCPVRKHIETSVDNMDAVIITYKGVHDHDMPVPKKRHGPPSAPLVAAAAPASMNNVLLKKSEMVQNPTKWSVDNEGELAGEAMDLGGEKAMESARTLLSIGFEIKPC